jgi:CheY-like chemotaxis protein
MNWSGVEGVRQQFRRDIRSGRFVMEFAASAAEALEHAKTITDPSLILSDINMPGMSGLEMLAKVKLARPNLPVIMITAYGDEATRKKAAELGAAGLAVFGGKRTANGRARSAGLVENDPNRTSRESHQATTRGILAAA